MKSLWQTVFFFFLLGERYNLVTPFIPLSHIKKLCQRKPRLSLSTVRTDLSKQTNLACVSWNCVSAYPGCQSMNCFPLTFSPPNSFYHCAFKPVLFVVCALILSTPLSVIYGCISVRGTKCLRLCLMESKPGAWMRLFALELNSLLGRVRTRLELNVRKSLVFLSVRMCEYFWALSWYAYLMQDLIC